MLFGVEPSDLAGPLVQFQATVFSKEEVQKFIRTVNQQLDGQALDAKVLDSVFDKWWPELEEAIQKILSDSVASKDANVRSDREILEEILGLTRRITTRERQLRQTDDEDKNVEIIASSKTLKAINSLIDHSQTQIEIARNEKALNEFQAVAHEIMEVLWVTLPSSTRARISPRVNKMFEQLSERVKELDEVPF